MDWMNMTEQQISETLSSFGAPSFRTKQVMEWLKRGVRPAEMSNLPKSLREQMASIPFGGASIFQKYVSQRDGTIKYLFSLEDGNIVEGVLMRYSYGNTVCLSTQIGCKMGCKFCASTLEGCIRNLTPGEMLGQIYQAMNIVSKEDEDYEVSNVVVMGTGEPLCYQHRFNFQTLVVLW